MKPKYWKLLFVESMRFACLLDCDCKTQKSDAGEIPLQLSMQAVVNLAHAIQKNYHTIGMPIPKLRAIAYNKDDQEIKEKSFTISAFKPQGAS